eukprot:CAMPEP_0194393066 /NCGR_PEP_ID=MMETSP0174-20130528/123087_1 /TAXON_ID=216777 /ORGANISM="Proboscia alata, Strain PI-D3" /LENGTH=589 /DNA_ID=CAMNT_0039188701 /DNA_START=41 /DNA_END=1810 /DNA_ORIENTATION=-
MNAGASSWKPSVAATSWTPTAATPVSAPPAQDTAMEEEIDESDPLWKAVLKVAKGDRSKAQRMINDPDSLMQYPEVAAVLEAGDVPAEDWEGEADAVAEKLEDMAIDAAPAPTAMVTNPAVAVVAQKPKPVLKEVPIEAVKEGDPREHVNLVFIGHVDAGKSTLSGNILYLTDNVDKRTIEKYEKEAKDLNRESWFLAFIMDTNEEERAKGKTVEVGRAHFDTEVKRYTILDAPGHKNYVPNMIMGACQADVGVLVISARKGEFETGFDRGGQTREHAMLAKTLGVSYLVVVINKMDDPTVMWSKVRFDECISKLRPYLKSCGYIIKKEVKFLPISGLGGANVKDEVDAAVCPWWKKSYTNGDNNTSVGTLIGLLDTIELKERVPDAPVRIPVLGRYTDRGTIAMGKVESGTIRAGMKVVLMPTRNEYKVEGVWANEEPVLAARPGENVLVKLGGGCAVEDCQKGFVICSKPPCRAVSKMICDIALLDMPDSCQIMTAGFGAIFHCHCCEEECTITKIFETTNAKGQVNKKAQYAKLGMRVKCMIEVARTVPVETFEDGPFLGRFTLRSEGKTVAIGKISKLPPKKEDK